MIRENPHCDFVSKWSAERKQLSRKSSETLEERGAR